MNTSLQLFQFQSNDVRIVQMDDVPWFVLSDLCRAVEISNSRDAASRLNKADVGQTDIRSGGQMRKVTVVNESGMWDVVLDSHKPAAKAFRRWVTSAVLPSIRQTGSYSTAPAPLALTREQRMAQAMLDAQEIMAEQSVLIQELTPKAEFFDSFVVADNWWDVRDAAQLLRNEGIDTGGKRLFAWMRENGWLDKKNRPLQYRLTQGLLELKLSDYVVKHVDGAPRYADPQVRVTPKGLDRLRKELTAPPKEQKVLTVAATTRKPEKRKSLNPDTKLSLVGYSRKAI